MKKLFLIALSAIMMQSAYADYQCKDEYDNSLYIDTKFNTVTVLNHTENLMTLPNGKRYQIYNNGAYGVISDNWINFNGVNVYLAVVIHKNNKRAFGIFNYVTNKEITSGLLSCKQKNRD